jgi:hypothetical protein
MPDRKFGAVNFAAFNIADPDRRYASIEAYRGPTSYTCYMRFMTRPNQPTRIQERMRIRHDGIVSIGNDGTPVDANNFTRLIIGSNLSGVLDLGSNRTTGNLGGVEFFNYAITATDKRVAAVGATVGTDAGYASGHLTFYTRASGQTTLTSERMRITETGNVGIGMTAPMRLLQLGSDSAAKPTTGTWEILSDERTKRNVRNFEGGLSVIRELQPQVAEYNGKARTPDGGRVVSLDPAKLRKLVPAAVSAMRTKLDDTDIEETNILTVNYHEVIYHMLLSIQQLDVKLQTLIDLAVPKQHKEKFQ